MNNLHKIIIDLGIEPNILLAFIVLLVTFLSIITILYICVPFFLLRKRKEIIEVNKNLRILYILDSKAKTNGKNEEVSDDNKLTYDKKSSSDYKKFQLDDDDIRKLKATGLEIE